jgi:alginate O-acetyltransferase complex protein AlgI
MNAATLSNFTSPTFLFLFLPVTLAAYFAAPKILRNLILLAASLLFYADGERAYALVMVFSIVFNYAMGLAIDAAQPLRARRALLVAAVIVNLTLLATFKYATFIVRNVDALLAFARLPPIPQPRVHLPIGISFFTFHALSYVTDVYRREVRAMRRFDSFALYVTLFPQLIAGPIIRYKIIAAQLSRRDVTLASFAIGVRRFVVGLGKKLIIGDTVAYTADQIFNHAHTALLTPGVAWLGVACYTLQIYFDFSGYSDMAVGMGRMFGFVFPENFAYPYVAGSITEFWRRWHMTLSGWFRDYLYVPLGGNRRRPLRVYLNLLAVFFLCGLWHGATWSFVVWGLLHGGFLIVERLGGGRLIAAAPRFVRHAYVMVVVMVGWVFFNCADLSQALAYLKVMFGLAGGSGLEYNVPLYANPALVVALGMGVVGATPLVQRLARRCADTLDTRGAPPLETLGRGLGVALHAALFLLCALMAAHGSYSPFIYYRF